MRQIPLYPPDRVGDLLDVFFKPFQIAAETLNPGNSVVSYLGHSIPVALKDSADWVKEAWINGEKWLEDFAKTEVGKWVISVITAVAFAALATFTGPLVAYIVFNLPSLLNGDALAQNFIEIVTEKIEGLVTLCAPLSAAAGGAGALIDVACAQGAQALANAFRDNVLSIVHSPEVQGAIKDVENTVTNQGNRGSVQAIQKQVLEAGITPQILAARYNIREDAAATILNKDLSVRNMNGTVTPLYKLDEFDDLTGKYRGPLRSDLLKAAVDAAQKPDVLPLPAGIVSAIIQRQQIAQELQDEAQKGIVIIPSTPNVAKEVLTLAFLTSPVWGQYVYRRFKKR